MLLHCYPFHRQAGYLAQAFGNVYFDVGLARTIWVRSAELLAESLELAPFAKQLYSSDGYGPPELHLLGSVLWRRGDGPGARPLGTRGRLVPGRRGAGGADDRIGERRARVPAVSES